MKKQFGIGGIAVVVYLLTLLIHTPSSRLVHWFVPESVRISGPQGSLMQGQMAQLQWQNWHLEQVHWRLHPWALLSGRAVFDLSFHGDLSGQAQGVLTPWGWQIRQVNTQIAAAALLSHLFRDEPPVQLSGIIQLQNVQFQPSEPGCRKLTGQIRWQDPQLQSALGALKPSPLQGQLTCDNAEPRFQLTHRGVLFSADGNVRLSPDRWQWQMNFKPTAQFPQSYLAVVKQYFRVSKDGFYHLERSGKLTP
ncbi:type II secretion system protein N [Celerinatantimonas sp. YJH-8]|uniref:type II secretion system protein N n=1 Tax=Celerinatantimonas sp. YJH-8 TaxID=3228714 RepID=UPI0038C316A0